MMKPKTSLLALGAGLGALAVFGIVAFGTRGHSSAQTPPVSTAANAACSSWPNEGTGYGPGGMMNGGSGYGPGMMGGRYGAGAVPGASATSVPQSMDAAKQAVAQAAAQYGIPNPTVTEVMEFQCNYYGIVANGDTGQAATEMLVDKTTGATFIEYGPAMLWNTQYGMMDGYGGGMMRGWGRSTNQASVTADQATQLAQQWLDANQPGNTTGDVDVLPGYYTLHIMQSGQITGMLSVNAYTGAVWYHSWHGAFMQMQSYS